MKKHQDMMQGISIYFVFRQCQNGLGIGFRNVDPGVSQAQNVQAANTVFVFANPYQSL